MINSSFTDIDILSDDSWIDCSVANYVYTNEQFVILFVVNRFVPQTEIYVYKI